MRFKRLLLIIPFLLTAVVSASERKPLPPLRDELCNLPHDYERLEQVNQGFVTTLTAIFASHPETDALTLVDQFNEQAAPEGASVDSVSEHEGWIVAHLFDIYCPSGSHDISSGTTYVFDRYGHSWRIANAQIRDVIWLEDGGWTALFENLYTDGNHAASVGYVNQRYGVWGLRDIIPLTPTYFVATLTLKEGQVEAQEYVPNFKVPPCLFIESMRSRFYYSIDSERSRLAVRDGQLELLNTTHVPTGVWLHPVGTSINQLINWQDYCEIP